MSTQNKTSKSVVRKKISPQVVVEQVQVMPLWGKISLGVLAVGVVIMLYLFFTKPSPVIIPNNHDATQKAYEKQHQSDSATIAFKDSVGAEAMKEAAYWKAVATEKQRIIINNQQLYLNNEKKYQNIINGIKPIGDLDSLRRAIKPQY